MPALNLNSLDDTMIVDATGNFTGGQISFGPADQIPAVAARELVNVDTVDGTATTRRGAESLGAPGTGQIQGIAWYDTPDIEQLVVFSSGTPYEYDGSTWAQITGYSAPNTVTQICFAQLIDLLYFAQVGANLMSYDGTSITDLGAVTGTPGDPPTSMAFVIQQQGRLWGAGIPDSPDTLWVSYILDGTMWNATYGNIRVGSGDGDPITGICGWDQNRIAVFKRNSIYIVSADPQTTTTVDLAHSLANASITKLSDTIGCVSHRSIARVGNDIWFLSDDGVFSLGDVLAVDQKEIKQAHSFPVQDIIDRINWNYASSTSGFCWQNRYFISLPLDDETAPNNTLVFNTKRPSWNGLWTGWAPLCFALSKRAGNERMVFGRPDGYVWQWLEYIRKENEVETDFQDAGVFYPTAILTRAHIFNDAICLKSLLNCTVEFFESHCNATVGVIIDEGEPTTLQADFSTAAGILLLPFTLPAILPNDGLKRRAFGCQHIPQFRNTQILITAAQDKLSLRAVLLTGFEDTIQLEIA